MPRVSVIIPTHSRPTRLPKAVSSAHQAGEDVEVIVVDDASSDETARVCRYLSGIRYIRLDRNQGTAGARNAGIQASTAEYISFLDDDDFRLPGSLDRQIDVLDADSGLGFVYGPVFSADQLGSQNNAISPGSCPVGDIFWKLLSECFIPCLSVVFRKNAGLRINLLNPRLRGFDDWDFLVRMAEKWPASAVDEPVGVWREPTPASGQGTSRMASLLRRLVSHQTQLFRLPRAAAAPSAIRSHAYRQLRDWASDSLIAYAAAWMCEPHRSAARSNLLTALCLNPYRAVRPWTFQLLLRSFFPVVR